MSECKKCSGKSTKCSKRHGFYKLMKPVKKRQINISINKKINLVVEGKTR